MRYFGRGGMVGILRRSLQMAAWLGERIGARVAIGNVRTEWRDVAELWGGISGS